MLLSSTLFSNKPFHMVGSHALSANVAPAMMVFEASVNYAISSALVHR